MSDDLRYSLARSRWRARRADWYETLASALEDKEAVPVFLARWQKRAQRRKEPEALLYARWLRRSSGMTLGDILGDDLPPLDRLVLGAVGDPDRLPEVLRYLAEQTRKMDKARAGVKQAIVWLTIPALAAIGFVWFYLGTAWPRFKGAIPRETWSPLSEFLDSTAHLFAAYWAVLFPLLIALILFLALSPRWLTGRTRDFLDRLPPWSWYRDQQAAVVLVSLGLMVESKVALPEALHRLNTYGSKYLRWRVRQLANPRLTAGGQHVMVGANPAAGLAASALFRRDLSDLIEDFGARSGFAEAVQKIGRHAVEWQQRRLEALAALATQVGLLVLGSVMLVTVGGFAWTNMNVQDHNAKIADRALSGRR